MRESESFRSEMEQLNLRFPGKSVLTILDVASYTGKSVNTVKKRFPFVKRSADNPSGGCTKTTLAKAMKG